MKLGVKIGGGFAILVFTCLCLTIGMWVTTEKLSSMTTRLTQLTSLERDFHNSVLSSFKEIETALLQSEGTESKNDQITAVMADFKNQLDGWINDFQQKTAQSIQLKTDTLLSALGSNAGSTEQVLQQLKSALQKDITNPSIELEEAIAKTHRWTIYVCIFLSIAGTVSGIIISLVITRMITKPINLTIDKVKEIATGNLTIEIPKLTNDEIGSLADAMNSMTSQLNVMFGDIQANGRTISKSAHELNDLAKLMTKSADQTASDTTQATSAADELVKHIERIAAAMEDSSMNINSVVAAIEEMTSTVNEISGNAQTASSISGEAVSEAQEASRSIEQLGQAAQEINKVTETIEEIADQTNLLALNATIEAARAGEAGKGFAVVANEIKELAKQTTESTQLIGSKMEGVAQSMQLSVEAIGNIASTIGRVNDRVSNITTSVEEQAAVSLEISANATRVSSTIQELNENIADASSTNRSIAGDLESVRQEVRELTEQCTDISTAAANQENIADTLNAMSKRFTIS